MQTSYVTKYQYTKLTFIYNVLNISYLSKNYMLYIMCIINYANIYIYIYIYIYIIYKLSKIN